MAKIRQRGLASGWYPGTAGEIREMLSGWTTAPTRKGMQAGVAPHAGWFFCGALIAEVLAEIPENTDSIVILGGHNPPGGSFISYSDEAWALPSGLYRRDEDLSQKVEAALGEDCTVERTSDNTVEVVLAMAAALRPQAMWAAWRVPSDNRSLRMAAALADAAGAMGKNVVAIGSTDLTHYGPNYGFIPPESRGNPASWSEKQDRSLLRALAHFDGDEALRLGVDEKAACSVGGAVTAMEYARIQGAGPGSIVSYATSREKHPSSSFVGYASLVWNALQR